MANKPNAEYEIQIKAALRALGTAKAAQVAQWTGLYRSAVYRILTRLCEAGVVEKVADAGRVAHFKMKGE